MTKVANDQEQAQQQTQIEFSSDRYLAHWMSTQQISIAFTTYQTGHLMFLGVNAQEQLTVQGRGFQRAMGLYATPSRLYMSTVHTLLQFENVLTPGEIFNGFDRLYVPRLGYVTGDLDIHDIIVDDSGRLIFANTLHSCIATVSSQHSFKPLWKPPFISKLAPEDRCHLNGLAIRDGQARYVTMISRSDATSGWRDRRWEGGMVMDIQTDEIITQKLSMPHSPRYHSGKLWVLNSGTGYFGSVNLDTGEFEPLTFCPGYMRGLAFHNNFAIIGLSQPRSKAFSELSLDQNLKDKDIDPKCGLVVVDLDTGNIPHWFYFDKGITELYDVQVIPGYCTPIALDFNTVDINQLITIEQPDSPLEGPYQAATTLTVPTQHTVTYRFRLSRDMTVAAAMTDFSTLVFPELDSERGYHEPLIAVVAGDGTKFVAMALAELTPEGDRARLISMLVAPEHRRRGLASNLLLHLQQALQNTACKTLEFAYSTNWESKTALEHIVKDWEKQDSSDENWHIYQKSLSP